MSGARECACSRFTIGAMKFAFTDKEGTKHTVEECVPLEGLDPKCKAFHEETGTCLCLTCSCATCESLHPPHKRCPK